MTDKKTKRKNRKHDYIDNQQFALEMSAYVAEFKQSILDNEDRPRISESVGKSFYLIATNLAYSPNFINYTFRDDMIGDAIENCVKYCHNYDPERKNAFSYFTQYCWNAFIRRIKLEDKMQEKKKMAISRIGFDTISSTLQEHDEGTNYENGYVEYLHELQNEAAGYEIDTGIKRRKRVIKKSKVFTECIE